MSETVVNKGLLRSLAKMPVPEHTGIYNLHLQASATLGTAGVRASVKLPPGIDRDEWLASQLVGIFTEVGQVMCVLMDICCEGTCPRMSAGKHVLYNWADETDPTPRPLPAKEYMRTLMEYAQTRLEDRKLLPIDGSPLPPEFHGLLTTLCKRFFRVYAHAYISHFQVIDDHDAQGHLNFCFKHFLFFVLEFDLLSKEEMQPLEQLIARFVAGQ